MCVSVSVFTWVLAPTFASRVAFGIGALGPAVYGTLLVLALSSFCFGGSYTPFVSLLSLTHGCFFVELVQNTGGRAQKGCFAGVCKQAGQTTKATSAAVVVVGAEEGSDEQTETHHTEVVTS